MPPLGIEFNSRFRMEARGLPAEREAQLILAVAQLSEVFGQPHLQGGLGIRRLNGNYFEFRTGRDTRAVFTLEAGTAILRMVGNHDDVRKYLKNI